MTPEEIQDADNDFHNSRREAAKTTILTSVQAFLRLFLVSAIIGLVGDWFLNRDVRHTLVSDNRRTVAWIEEHKQDFLKLLVSTAKHDTRENTDALVIVDMRNAINDLQTRMRRAENAISVTQNTLHNGNGK